MPQLQSKRISEQSLQGNSVTLHASCENKVCAISASGINSVGVLNSAGSGSGPKNQEAVQLINNNLSALDKSVSSDDDEDSLDMDFGRPDTPSIQPSQKDLND